MLTKLCVCCRGAVLAAVTRTKGDVCLIEADSFSGGSPEGATRPQPVRERAEVSCKGGWTSSQPHDNASKGSVELWERY
ncbi:hypothetical protein BDR03DRAFT_953462 [Suillus americanus]|nr:hypothetical protein BDR03DRAFT_953462 [Suillus americanus]